MKVTVSPCSAAAFVVLCNQIIYRGALLFKCTVLHLYAHDYSQITYLPHQNAYQKNVLRDSQMKSLPLRFEVSDTVSTEVCVSVNFKEMFPGHPSLYRAVPSNGRLPHEHLDTSVVAPPFLSNCYDVLPLTGCKSLSYRGAVSLPPWNLLRDTGVVQVCGLWFGREVSQILQTGYFK